jgi:GT2 family glycosyltransferase
LLGIGVDYVFLLNDDTEVARDLLSVLVAEAERQASIGIIGPKICYFDRPDVIWSAGGSVDAYGQPCHLGTDAADHPSDASVHDVDYVTGCGMLVKRAVIETVGTLDERFFAYFEETEWCARAQRAGFRVVYAPNARMWHKIDMDVRTTSPLYVYLMTRNRLLYLKCKRASAATIGHATVQLVRTALSWRWRPEHRAMRPYAPVLMRGIRDFMLGRFGPPPALAA